MLIPKWRMISSFSASGEVVQALDAGACGAIVKDSSQEDLVAAIALNRSRWAREQSPH